jgi:hypothetical protein
MARRFAAEIKGLREIRLRFSDIAKAMAGDRTPTLSRVSKTVVDAYGDAAMFVRDKARSNASSAGVPRRLFSGSRPAIFAFADFDAASDNKRKRSSLVGVRTGLSSRAKDPHLFIEWGKGHRRRKDGTIAQRGLAMSFGALFERGTQNRRIRAARYFRSAVFSTRGAVARILTTAYERAVEVLNKLP